jgi:glutathione S-transferase kappa 1
VYVRDAYPRNVYEALFEECFKAGWVEAIDLSKADNMMTVVKRVFDRPEDIEAVSKSPDDPAIKKQLSSNTERAFKNHGAFGCPWYWVSDGKGRQEPFFGSDRYHYMWAYLDLPHCGMELLPPGETCHTRARL